MSYPSLLMAYCHDQLYSTTEGQHTDYQVLITVIMKLYVVLLSGCHFSHSLYRLLWIAAVAASFLLHNGNSFWFLHQTDEKLEMVLQFVTVNEN